MPITLPLAEQIPPNDHWADEMNAALYAYNQPRELSTIQAEFTAAEATYCAACRSYPSMISMTPMAGPQSLGNLSRRSFTAFTSTMKNTAHELEQLRA